MNPKDLSTNLDHSINVTLYGQRDFVHVIGLGFWRWGDYLGLCQWALNVITMVITRRKQTELDMEEEKKVI